MYTYNNDNASIFNEYKTRKVDTSPRSLEELYGAEYATHKYRIPDIEEPNELALLQLNQDDNWKRLCSSSYYVHLRICGRNAQIRNQDRGFSLEDLFRLYRYNVMFNKISLYDKTGINYNRNAHLWVFYISVKNPTDSKHYLYVQPPVYNGAIKVVLDGITPNKGMMLRPYNRDSVGFKNILKYKDELDVVVKRHAKEFSKAFADADKFFNDDERQRTQDMAIHSYYESPYDLIYG